MEKRSYSTLLRPIISCGIIVFILWKVGPASLIEAFASSRWGYVVLAALLSGVFVTMKSIRWDFMLSRSGNPCGLACSARSYLGGMSVAIVTPGRVGELARALFVPVEDKTPVVALALTDKILDVICIFTVGCLGAFHVVGPVAGVPTLLLAGALLASLFNPGLFGLAAKPFRSWKGLASRLERSVDVVASIRSRDMAVAICLAMATLLLAVFQFHLILISFNSQPFLTSAVVMPLLVLANFVPFVMSGIGAREGLSIVLMRPYGVEAAAAVNTALLLFIFNTAGPAVVGVLVAGRGVRKKVPE